MARDRDDNPGVLGNLPRSRPGQRSTKRNSGSAPRKARAAAAARASAPKAKSSTRTTAKRSAPARPSSAQRPRSAPAARNQSSDPLGQAVQLAGKVATLGLKTAAGIVKRLPRP